MLTRNRRNGIAASLVVLSGCAAHLDRPASPLAAVHYQISIDERQPDRALVRLTLPQPAQTLHPARDGDGGQVSDVRCGDGRPLVRIDVAWPLPSGCTTIEWRVALEPIDDSGFDASLPRAAHSQRHRYWILPERAALLRASNAAGALSTELRLRDAGMTRRRFAFPSNTQPPFYAVLGGQPAARYRQDGVSLNILGDPPGYPWMDNIHGHVLAAWARWRRDLVVGDAPSTIDWAWIEAPASLEPGYNASAGADAILSQIKLRPGDPDAEAKARAVIATSAAHEGFHTITGAAGQAWPAWVNESLANHYAIEAARAFLPPGDFRFIELFYFDPDMRGPLLAAQADYTAGDGSQAQLFYSYGARFWREIEAVLTQTPNPSGRLAALIKSSRNFAGVDLNDAAALAGFLDRHSDGRAGPIVRCFLQGNCPAG